MKIAHARTRLVTAVFLLCLVLCEGYSAASSTTLSCRGRSRLTYTLTSSSSSVGDVIRVGIVLGAGHIDGGTALWVSRVRFNLDCDRSSMGINCPDDGPVVSYQGALITTCPSVTFTSSHSVGDALPNQVVFTSSSPILIPAETESFCNLEFDVRIDTGSHDGTHDVIEQIAGFNAATGDGVCNTRPPLGAGNTNSGQICLGAACRTTETTCEAFEELTYPNAPNLVAVGSVLRPRISLGAGHNAGGDHLIINRFRFDLDCDRSDLGIYCADDGPVMSYQGSIMSTCGVSWTASHAPGDTFPNQVVFTPSSPITIPADTLEFCSLEFNVRVEGRGNDGTPDALEQVCGLDAATSDATCMGGSVSASGDAEAGSLGLAPICDDGNPCNGLEIYEGNACASGPPLDCDDANSCTTDMCDPLQGCAHWGSGSCRSDPKEQGYWKRLCRRPHSSQDSLTLQDVDCVNNACTFSSIATTADLCARLDPDPPSDKCEQAEAQFMVLMLNVCRGRVSEAETVHSECGESTTIREARAQVDAFLCDPARSPATCNQTHCAAGNIAGLAPR